MEAMRKTLMAAVGVLALLPRGSSSRLREGQFERHQPVARELNGDENYYFSTSSMTDLGRPNPSITAGNPMKGLVGSPDFTNFDSTVGSIDASMESFFVGLDELMIGDPDVVGIANAFNWSALEYRLQRAASRNRHAVFTVMCHYPGRPLNVPHYLLEANITLRYYPNFEGGGLSPDYGDSMLLKALEQFVRAFGARYDGDTRIGFVHLGLLGFWGEWHTFPEEFVPENSKTSLVQWYSAAFKTTRLMVRFPFAPAYRAGMGLSDGSFTYETLDGDANGGMKQPAFYFWPVVTTAGQTDFWRAAPMGGETWPDQQPNVFESWYDAGAYQKQDFMRCVNATHASFV